MPRDWKGELFERELVVPLPSKLESETIQVHSLPPDVVLGMLHSRGIGWTEDDLSRRYADFLANYKKWEAVAEGKSYDGLGIRMTLQGLNPIRPDEYTTEQLEAWRAVQASNSELSPVMDCVRAYRHILTSSLEIGALSAVPLDHSTLSEMIGTMPTDAEVPLSLLRLTCSEFRRVPIGRNLRSTIEISETGAAMALRTKIAEWTAAAHEGSATMLDTALQDMARARRALTGATTVSRTGSYITVIGAVATALSLPGSFPLAAGVSVLATFAGAATLGIEKALRFTHKRAMIGQV